MRGGCRVGWRIVWLLSLGAWGMGTAGAAPPVLVEDLAPGIAASSPDQLVNLNGALLFAAESPQAGRELRIYSGSGSIGLASDVYPGVGSSKPLCLTVSGAVAFFTAVPSGDNRELYRTNGTPAGTIRVRDIRSGTFSSTPDHLVAFGTGVLLGANDGVTGQELWKSDGTQAGTVLVKDIDAGPQTSSRHSTPIDFVCIGNVAYFSAADAVNGRELWRTDGTTAGTVLVKNIHTGSSGRSDSEPMGFTALSVGGADVVIFVATDAEGGRELWRTAGTGATTVRVFDICPGPGSSSPKDLVRFGNRVALSAYDDSGGRELWASTGEPGGTARIRDIRPGASGSAPYGLCVAGGLLYFAADDGTHGIELWKSDGTAEGTVLVKDIAPGPLHSAPSNLAAVGDRLAFSADDGVNGTQVWTSDGTDEGTVMAGKIGDIGCAPGPFLSIGSWTYFPATHSSLGRELCRMDHTDLAAPRVAAVTRLDDNPTAAATVRFRVQFSEAVTGVDAGDFCPFTTGTLGATVTALAGSGSTYTVTCTVNDGEGWLGLAVVDDDTIRDGAGNYFGGWGAATPAAAVGERYYVDREPPGVSLSAPSRPATSTDPVRFRVTYTGASSVDLSPLDVSLLRTGTANGSVTVEGSGTSERTVVVSGFTGEGTLRIALSAGTARDAMGHLAPAVGPGIAFLVDTTPPGIAVGPPSAGLVCRGPVTYTVTYSDASEVTLSPAQVSLVRTGTANGAVTVSGTGLTRTVAVDDITGNGRLGIAIAAGSACDEAGNPAPAASGATFAVDTSPPIVTVSGPSQGLTRGGPVMYALTYTGASEIVLSPAMVSIEATGTAAGEIEVSGSGNERIVTVAAITGDGTLAIAVAPGSARDDAGNLAPALGPTTAFTVDNTRPTVALGEPSTALTRSGPVTFSVAYSGADRVDLKADDVTVHATGSARATATVSGTGLDARTVTLTGITGDGTLAIALRAGTARDDAGNTAPALGPTSAFTVDNTPPAVALGDPDPPVAAAVPIVFPLAYTGASEVTLTPADVTVEASETAACGDIRIDPVPGDPGRYSVCLSGNTGDGTLRIRIAPGTAVDAAGNTAPAAGPSPAARVDHTPPQAQIALIDPNPVQGNTVRFRVEFSEPLTFTRDHFTLTGTAAAYASATVEGADSVYVVLADLETAPVGTGLGLALGPDIRDAAGHACAAVQAPAEYVIEARPFEVGIDGPVPTHLRNGSASYTVNYWNASAITLRTADVSLRTTGTARASVAVSGSGTKSRTVTLSGISGNGSLRISIAAGTAVDARGNTAAAAGPSERVYVDNVSPVISLIGPSEVTVMVGLPFIDPGVQAVDALDGDIAARVVVSGTPNTAAPGDFTVRYEVSDRAGNTAYVTRIVHVRGPAFGPGMPLRTGPVLLALLILGAACLRPRQRRPGVEP